MYGGNSVTKWATEYWIHFEGGDLHVLEGKQWRKWKDYIDHSFEGDKVILIERVNNVGGNRMILKIKIVTDEWEYEEWEE